MDPSKQSDAPRAASAAALAATSLGDRPRRHAALAPPPKQAPHVLLTRTAPMSTPAADLAAVKAKAAPPAPTTAPSLLPHGLTKSTPPRAAPVKPPLPLGLLRATPPPDDARSLFDKVPQQQQGGNKVSLLGGAGAHASPFFRSSVASPPCISPATSNPCVASATSLPPSSSATPSKQITGSSSYGSRPTTSAANLAAYLNTMRLHDPSPSQQEQLQQRFAAPNSPPLMRPPQPQPIASTLPTQLHPMSRELQMPQQHYHPQPQISYGGDHASSSASPFGSYNLNLAGPSTSPLPPPSCTLSTNFATHSSMAPYTSCLPQPCSSFTTHSSTPPLMSTASSSWASHSGWSSSTGGHPLGGGAATSSPSIQEYDYCDMLLNSLRDTEAGASTWWCFPPARQFRTVEEIRSDLLRGPMEYSMTMFPETSAHVVTLLEEGGDGIRASVLAGVKRYARTIMDYPKVHPVFLALLRACEGHPHELHEIVTAVVSPHAGDKHSARNRNRVASLKALITAAAPYRTLCGLLVPYLVREGLLHNTKGEEVLRHCFSTMSYDDSMVLIRFAIINFDSIVMSQPGSKCLVECFAAARGAELLVLEEKVVSDAKRLARGPYSNYFMQRVLEHGREELKRGVVEALMEDVVGLSHDAAASYVVETCFLGTGSPALLLRVLAAFHALRDDQLADVVLCERGNYVVHKLVAKGKTAFPEQTLGLARRIARLPPAVLRQEHAMQVMRVIRRLFRHQFD